jgi:hypothetical protein
MSKKKRSNHAQVTPKQMLLAEKVVDGALLTTARHKLLADVGYSREVAKSRPSDVFSSEGFKKALVSLGVTPEKLATPALEAIQATKGSFYQGEYYETDQPDHLTRMKGSEQLAEFLGLKKNYNVNTNVNVNVDYSEVEGLF